MSAVYRVIVRASYGADACDGDFSKVRVSGGGKCPVFPCLGPLQMPAGGRVWELVSSLNFLHAPTS